MTDETPTRRDAAKTVAKNMLLGSDISEVSTDDFSISPANELHAETAGTLTLEDWMGDATAHTERVVLETPKGDYEITAEDGQVVIGPVEDGGAGE